MERTFDLSPWRESHKLDISSVRLRVLNGEDDSKALALMSSQKVLRSHAQMSMSVIGVDGVPCKPEASPVAQWNPRTRLLVLNAWNQLHARAPAMAVTDLNGQPTDVDHKDIVEQFADQTKIATWYDLKPYAAAVTNTLRQAGVECESGLSVAGFALRELTAQDEMAIATRMQRTGAPVEYARLSYAISEYATLDGKRASPDPGSKDRFIREPWRGWSYHTCEFVQAAFQALHEPMEAIVDFLALHAGPPSSATASKSKPESSSTG